MPTAMGMATMTAAMTASSEQLIVPDWPAPANVRALMTTRRAGVSGGAYASFNLGAHVGDAPEQVSANRRLLTAQLPAEPVWLDQRHGIRVVDAARCAAVDGPPQADAAVARAANAVCAVLTADCLPVLLCDARGSVVAAAHAGWRGLLAGILEESVRKPSKSATRCAALLSPPTLLRLLRLQPCRATNVSPTSTGWRANAWPRSASSGSSAATTARSAMKNVFFRTAATASLDAWRR